MIPADPSSTITAAPTTSTDTGAFYTVTETFTIAAWGGTEQYSVIDGYTYKNVTYSNGPLTITTVLTSAKDFGTTSHYPCEVCYSQRSSDRCDSAGDSSQISELNRQATFLSPTTLTDGQTTTVYGNVDDPTTTVLTGPTTAELTSTHRIFYEPGPGNQMPGDSCEITCGRCGLVFPEVFVNYWPVEGQDNSCLGSSNSSSSSSEVEESSSAPAKIRMRAIRGRQVGASTVVSNGYTL